ncbi:hypothetical protein [Gordonia sp. NPDC058843]|uniref:hypothetical protein n=1 Tax=Gordonia sp. NPDC058843 TaxID=3346648 RepID=UPI003680E029
MGGERQWRRVLARERASPGVDGLGDPAVITGLAGGECRAVDEVATDVADDEAAAVGNRETAGLRPIGVGVV